MDKIILYFLDTAKIKENIGQIKKILRQEETEKAERFVREKDKLLSYGSSYLKRKYACGDAEIKISDRGKPYGGDKHFSVSHSVDTVCLAVSDDCEIGVDTELERDGYDDLAERCLTEDEKRSGEKFLALFTSKEALAKAEGSGLGEGVKNIPALPLDGKVSYKGKEYYRHKVYKNNYHISVCVCGRDFLIEEEMINEL